MSKVTPLFYGEHLCRFGQVYLWVTEQGALYRCAFTPFQPDHADGLIKREPELTKPLAEAIGQPDKPVRLAWQGSAFQLQVWQALTQIPYGETRSYQQIAQAMARPTAVRAVANAIAKNPIAWFVPCHRVIRHTGELGGYAWGISLKQDLLAHEHAELNRRLIQTTRS